MSNKKPEQSPIGDATQQLAADLHASLMSEMAEGKGSYDFDGATEAVLAGYPAVLFGTLALHIAGMKLHEGASAGERTAAVRAALQRITNTPDLYERVTGAQPGSGLVGNVGFGPFATEIDPEEAEAARKLQKEVARHGYFDRSMLGASGRAVRLEYTTTQSYILWATPRSQCIRRW